MTRKDGFFRGFSPDVMEARCQGRMMARRELCVTDFLKAQGLVRGASVLELGSGTGQTMAQVGKRFPDVMFYGVEPVAAYVEHACARYAPGHAFLKYLQGTAEEIPLPEASVDCAYAINIWHHVPLGGLRCGAQALARVIKPGGCLFLIEPNFRHPYVFIYQALTQGERCFFPWRELDVLKAFFSVERTGFCFLFPEAVRSLTPLGDKIEAALEGIPFLGGSVLYTCRRKR